jgi:hypothetical protein
MKFSLLLWILGRKLKAAAKKSAEFKNRVKEQNITVQIKTADNSRGRYYVLKDGEIESIKGIAPQSDVALVWSDPATGFTVMKSESQEVKMKALTEGKLKLEGDGGKALWFTETIKQMKAV